jgi:hypothetical protein
MSKYNIGDKAWFAGRESVEKSVICPDCFGKKYLTVILGDNSQVTIDCVACVQRGFEPPKGYVTYYGYKIDVSQVTINKVEISPNKTEYRFEQDKHCYIVYETDLFDTKEEAEERAKKLCKEYEEEELEKIHRKHNNNRSWGWNVHYYRRIIRQANKDIEYYTPRLDAAQKYAKEDKKKKGTN